MQWIVIPLKRYADFSGRASRMEFWVFLLFATLLTMAARYLDGLDGTRNPVSLGMGTAELAVSIAVLLPTVAVGVRRLHDSGRSGWWIMLIYLPWLATFAANGNERLTIAAAGALLVGGLAWVALMLLPGEATENRFGPPPAR
jgi:uncharacterized membrane protein YhaH (DUF805 family)